jgi:hypothetical protein
LDGRSGDNLVPFSILKVLHGIRPFEHSNLKRVVRVARRILCLLSLIAAGGFCFFVELLDNYSSIDQHRDYFGHDSLLYLAFDILTLATAIAVIVGLFRRQKARVIICRALLVVCASLSFWLALDLKFLSDYVFFSLREMDFRAAVGAGGGGATGILQGWSDYNFHKLFVYAGPQSLPDGRRLSLDEIDSFGGDLDWVRGCEIDARHLRDHFYVLNIYCG